MYHNHCSSVSKSFHVLNCSTSSEEETHHRFSRFGVFHPCLSRSLTDHTHTHTHTLSRQTVHAVTEGYGWCTFISRSWVPAHCHETDTEAKAKLWVHQGCLPCCLNISLSVYTEPSKSLHRSVNYTESWLLFSYRWIWIKCKVNDPAHIPPGAGRQCLARISLL